MKIIKNVNEAVNASVIASGSVIYTSGNAATPQTLLRALGDNTDIKHVALYSILILGEKLESLFTKERCQEITHRVIFNSHWTGQSGLGEISPDASIRGS